MAIYDETISETVTASTPLTNYQPVVLTDSLSDTVTGGSIFSGNNETSEIVVSSVTLASVLSALNEVLGEVLSTSTVTDSMTPELTQLESIISSILAASGLQRIDEVQGWVMNAKTKAFSQYAGFEFNSFFQHKGKFFGVTDQGVFELAGDTDDGADIDAFIMTGKDDFGTSEVKGVQYFYVRGEMHNGMVLETFTDDGSSYSYEISEALTLEAKRAILGKGLKSIYWKFALRNVGGGDFKIESIEIFPAALRRKLNG